MKEVILLIILFTFIGSALSYSDDDHFVPFVFNLRKPTDPFIERPNKLGELDWNSDDRKVTVITGEHGIGKTEMARKYAQDIRNKTNVIWIDCSSNESLIKNFKKLSTHLGIPNKDQNNLTIIKKCFKKFKDQPTLFVFDDAKNNNFLLPGVLDCVSDTKDCKALVTSRDGGFNESFMKFGLRPFNRYEAEWYLKRNLSQNLDDEQVDTIVNTVGGNPLKLHEAVEAIKADHVLEGKKNLAEYIRKLKMNNRGDRRLNTSVARAEKIEYPENDGNTVKRGNNQDNLIKHFMINTPNNSTSTTSNTQNDGIVNPNTSLIAQDTCKSQIDRKSDGLCNYNEDCGCDDDDYDRDDWNDEDNQYDNVPPGAQMYGPQQNMNMGPQYNMGVDCNAMPQTYIPQNMQQQQYGMVPNACPAVIPQNNMQQENCQVIVGPQNRNLGPPVNSIRAPDYNAMPQMNMPPGYNPQMNNMGAPDCNQNYRMAPQNMGPQPPYPQQVGMGPQQVCMGPQQVGMGPQQVGLGPQQVGMGPRQVGMGPQVCVPGQQNFRVAPQYNNMGQQNYGVAPQNYGMAPQNYGMAPQNMEMGPMMGPGMGPVRGRRKPRIQKYKKRRCLTYKRKPTKEEISKLKISNLWNRIRCGKGKKKQLSSRDDDNRYDRPQRFEQWRARNVGQRGKWTKQRYYNLNGAGRYGNGPMDQNYNPNNYNFNPNLMPGQMPPRQPPCPPRMPPRPMKHCARSIPRSCTANRIGQGDNSSPDPPQTKSDVSKSDASKSSVSKSEYSRITKSGLRAIPAIRKRNRVNQSQDLDSIKSECIRANLRDVSCDVLNKYETLKPRKQTNYMKFKPMNPIYDSKPEVCCEEKKSVEPFGEKKRIMLPTIYTPNTLPPRPRRIMGRRKRSAPIIIATPPIYDPKPEVCCEEKKPIVHFEEKKPVMPCEQKKPTLPCEQKKPCAEAKPVLVVPCNKKPKKQSFLNKVKNAILSVLTAIKKIYNNYFKCYLYQALCVILNAAGAIKKFFNYYLLLIWCKIKQYFTKATKTKKKKKKIDWKYKRY